MSKEGLLIALLKSSRSFYESSKGHCKNSRIEKNIEKFNRKRHTFLKPKIIRKKFFKIIKNENPSKLEREEIGKYLTELEKEVNKHKKYYDRDDPDYEGIRDVENLFGEVNQDYYKPVKTKSAFNGNYKEYERRRDKDRKLSIK